MVTWVALEVYEHEILYDISSAHYVFRDFQRLNAKAVPTSVVSPTAVSRVSGAAHQTFPQAALCRITIRW